MTRIPWPFSMTFIASGILATVTDGSVRFYALAAAASILFGFVALQQAVADSPRSVAARETTQSNPFYWLAGVYVAVVIQEVLLDDADIAGMLRSLPVALLITGAVLLVRRGYALDPRHLRAGLLAFFSVGVVVGLSGPSTSPCRPDKCSVVGALYRGGFMHENMMGLASSLAVVVLLFAGNSAAGGRRVALRLAVLAPLAALLASGSRAMLFGLSVAAVVLGATKRLPRHRRIILCAATSAIGAVALLLVTVAEPADFAFRGRRWVLIRESLDPIPIFGNGITGWTDQLQGAHSTTTHSTYASILVHGGLVAVALYLCFVASVALRARRARSNEILYVWLALAAGSLLETLWEPAALPARGWVVIAVALAAAASFDGPHPGTPQRRSEMASRRQRRPIRSALGSGRRAAPLGASARRGQEPRQMPGAHGSSVLASPTAPTDSPSAGSWAKAE